MKNSISSTLICLFTKSMMIWGITSLPCTWIVLIKLIVLIKSIDGGNGKFSIHCTGRKHLKCCFCWDGGICNSSISGWCSLFITLQRDWSVVRTFESHFLVSYRIHTSPAYLEGLAGHAHLSNLRRKEKVDTIFQNELHRQLIGSIFTCMLNVASEFIPC